MDYRAHSNPFCRALYRRPGWLTRTFGKTVLVMKLTGILLVAGILHVSAHGLAQTVTYEAQATPLTKVFDAIEKQTGYLFFYDKQDLRSALPVTVKLQNVPLEAALHTILEGQPVDFDIQGNTVVITKRVLAIRSGQLRADTAKGIIKVKGVVTSAGGEPLSGASVISKQTGRTTLTSQRGEFILSGVPVNSELIFSFVGFTPKRVIVKDEETVRVQLLVAVSQLDEEVVQAYGKTSQRLTTGDISKITAADIETQPVANVLQALEGRVPGMVVTQTSGYASAPYLVTIRGLNSINFNSIPLYIIDGVPLTVLGNTYSGFDQTGLSPAGGQSPFFGINPADIESIEVLKDADATSIYGSRGANGVILITTKRGKPGKTKFDLNVYQGESKVTRQWPLLNTSQYLEMRREGFANAGIAPSSNPGDQGYAPDLFQWDTTKDINWQKYLWGGTGKTTDAQASLAGGDANNTFRIAAGFHRETSILTVSGANQIGSLSFNLQHHSNDRKFAVSLLASYSYSVINIVSVPGAATLPPDAPPVFDSAGHLNYSQWDLAQSVIAYPFAQLKQPYTSQTGFLNSNMNLSYLLAKGLTLRTNIGFNNGQTDQTYYFSIASQDPQYAPTGTSQFGNNRNSNWIIEPQAEYTGLIGTGKLNVLVGTSALATTTDGLYVLGQGYTSDALLKTISNAVTVTSTDNYSRYKYASSFGRVNYNWQNKYIVNASARRDGSSRFGPGRQFGNFWSVGAAWIASEETWFKDHVPAYFSFFKLRGSYGTTGSDAVGDYSYLSRWSSNSLLPYDGVSPLVPLQLTDSVYHWPTNKKLEGAVDIGLFHDRVSIEAAFYRDRCDDQLLQYPTPLYTGFNSVVANWPADVQNLGMEFTVSAKIITHKNFSWTVNFNEGINKNKLLAYPNLSQSPYANTLVVGQSLSLIHVLHCTGVDPQTGQYAFEDKNHDGYITFNTGNHLTDDSYTLDIAPKFSGGVGNNFTYKGVQLSAFFSFRKQIGRNAFNSTGLFPGTMNNISTDEFQRRWRKPGDIASVARLNAGPTTQFDNDYYFYSDANWTDASFIRLSNVAVAYTLHGNALRKTGIDKISLFIRAENLFVITKYKGSDPETQNYGGMPPARVATAGVSFGF